MMLYEKYITITFIIFLILYYYFLNNYIENFTNICKMKNSKFFYIGKCKYKLPSSLETKLNNNCIFETKKNKKWSLFIPCTYDYNLNEIKKIKKNKSHNKKLFLIDGNDELASKKNLWNNFKNYLGIKKTLKYLPMTYILDDYKDIDRLKHEFKKNTYYILKKNTQRQDNIKITNSLEKILELKNDYVVVQKLLINPYIINNRKINIRIYVLITCKNNNINSYIFNDGFIYYTKKKFNKNSKNINKHITSGYIDRKIYDINPLTISDFKIYLDKNKKHNKYEKKLIEKNIKLSDYFFNNVKKIIKKSMIVMKPKICKKKKIKKFNKFELFGFDLFINDQLKSIIMEINKGPDLGFKDDRDKKLKNTLLDNIFQKMNIQNDSKEDNFIKIL
jgi:hypothetical protein